MPILWILIFIASIALIVKSADWLIQSSEKIGLAFKLSPFIIGVTIVAIGSSLPELTSAIVATLKGQTEIVVANAVGSNVVNILLILGLASVVAKTIKVRRSLINLDAPLLGITTVLFLLIILDGVVTFGEGILLLIGFVIYLLYAIYRRRESEMETIEAPHLIPSREERRRIEILRMLETAKGIVAIEKRLKELSIKLNYKVFSLLLLGIAGLAVGSYFVIEAMVQIAETDIAKAVGISTSMIAITALAIGTSLPELIISVKAAAQKKYEIAIGNIFGSNVFNVLLITGLPALIRPLKVDEITLLIGVPFFIAATVLLIISSVTRRIHGWEGAMYLLVYVLFIAKLTGLF